MFFFDKVAKNYTWNREKIYKHRVRKIFGCLLQQYPNTLINIYIYIYICNTLSSYGRLFHN
jgi:hypothetical protein